MNPHQTCTDQEFINIYRRLQSAQRVANTLGISHQSVTKRRKYLEKKLGIILPQFDLRPAYNRTGYENHDPKLIHIKIVDGCIVVFSDAHYHPAYPPSTCHRALVKFCKELKPKYVIANGDLPDFPSISRHHRIGWAKQPTIKDEIECLQDRLEEIEKASIGTMFYRIWGNHDIRFDGILSNRIPELEGLAGMSLTEHIPRWKPCWAIRINKDEAQISHRWKTSIHSSYNNTKEAGMTYGTGHNHVPLVAPWVDLNGLRFGFNSGTLSDFMEEDESHTDQFGYLEQHPVPWWSAFIVLNFVNGKMLEPMLVRKWDKNTVQYCGKLITV